MSEVQTMNNFKEEKEENSNSLSAWKAASAAVAEWTTWEELLLACAVKRHGVKDWDSVAMELQTRCFPTTTTTTTTIVLTPKICRDKFRDLQRRFTVSNENVDGGGDDITVPWLEELRKLRVAELKQEVHRYDLSIQSLQLKVKRLEDERERSLKENDEKVDLKTDLAKDKNRPNPVKHEDVDLLENDGKNGREETPEDFAGKSVSGENENGSVNGSNSTENRGTDCKAGLEPVEVKPEAVKEAKPVPVGEEDSCNDSSDRGKASRDEKVDSAELRDSVDESQEGTTTKESSDVQSSANLTRKTKGSRRGEQGDSGTGGGGNGVGDDGHANVETITTTTTTTTGATRREGVVAKSEPLTEFLDIIRSHKHGSLFERRLDVQKADKYKNMVRRHVDLQTIQTRMEDGSYYSCWNRFFLDLLLVFNNAIVFFPKSSPESLAAHELRDLAMKEINKNRNPSLDCLPVSSSGKFQSKPDSDRSGSDSLLAKHKSNAPLVVCRKRSSIVAKDSSSSAPNKVEKLEKLFVNKPLSNPKSAMKSSSTTQNEDDSLIKLKLKEKPVTGVRSMRRSGKGRPNSSAAMPSNTNSNQNTTSSSLQQLIPGSAQRTDEAKTDKKKLDLNNAAAKKRGAADFLKRMKKNSPGKGLSGTTVGSTVDAKGGKSDHEKKKVEERKDNGPLRRSGNGNGKQAQEYNSPSRRGVGRPPKKGKDPTPAGKRGREGGEGEGSSKRANKRSRR